MAQIAGQLPIRIECPDGNMRSTKVLAGDVDITHFVQSITWSLDVHTQYATVDIRFILAAASLVAQPANDSEPEYTQIGDEPVVTVQASRIDDSLLRRLTAGHY